MARKSARSPKPAVEEHHEASPTLADRPTPRNAPLVFISHDSRDADLAQAFDNLLTDASGGVIQTFRSSDQSGKAGIEYGENWYSKVASCLADASDVVALLTPNSTGRPWILFEAGWAVGRSGTKVFGISIGLPLAKAIVGPFAQFQNSEANEESLTGVVLQLIHRNPDARPREPAVRRQVAAFLEEIAPLVKKRTAGGESVSPELDSTAVAKLFEEVKVMFRDLSERGIDRNAKRRRRLNPMMLDEIFHMTRMESREPSVAWLMLASFTREDAPWVAEPAMEVYRALRSGSSRKIEDASRHFHDVVRMMRHSRTLGRGGPEDEDMFFLMRHLPEMLDQFALLPGSRERKVGRPEPHVVKASEPPSTNSD